MTTVDFPFGVKKNSEGEASFVDVRFRFTIRTARELERASVVGLSLLLARGQTVEALVLLVCYGLKWERKTMNEDHAVNLLDQFVEAGGNVNSLAEALRKALNESGVYGPSATATKEAIDLSLPPEPEPDPLAPTIQ
jgi:hypothetical protein